MSAPSAAVVPITVADSYRYCRQVARQRARNFYYAFLLLKRPQHDAMCAVYAFMRFCDDLSDDPEGAHSAAHRRLRVADWRLELARALEGEAGSHPLWPAFQDAVQRFAIPHRYFFEMIEGISSDLEPRRIQTFDELYRYCYQVASVVGLTIVHIFGFESVAALVLAEKCGVAFQLTNILRDVREDAVANRVYLPAEDLQRFGVTFDQLASGSEDHAFRELMKMEAGRAHGFFAESAPLRQYIARHSRPALWALRAIYMRLLERIEHSNYNVLSRRINVPTLTKLTLLGRAFLTHPS